MYVPTLEIIGCVFVSFLLMSPAETRHRHVTCLGGRQEGDKWYDGCKWCVCQKSGPLCSPAQCSDLTSRVPACSRLGSRWHDGCYECECFEHGIECRADRACVALMRGMSYHKHVMTLGACVQPRDDRCVCGVDGVPSCTVEVIDRNAHPATTIAFGLSLPYSTKESPAHLADDVDSFESGLDSRSDGNPLYRRIEISVDNTDSRHHRNSKHTGGSHKRTHSSIPEKQNDDWSRVGGRRSYDDFTDDSQRYYRERKRHEYSTPHISTRDLFDSYEPESRVSSQHPRGRHHKQSLDEYRERRPHHRQSRRFRRNVKGEWRLASVRNSEGQVVNVPGSLLVITDNRCRYGIRWYGGGLRCYCDQEGSVTCGDPSFVASRIDGFRLEKLACEEGHAWEENGSCQVCHCQISGVVLCRRSESCPLPFLIRPVTYNDEYYESTDDFSKANEDTEKTDVDKRRNDHKSVNVNLENKGRHLVPEKNPVIEVGRNRNSKIPLPGGGPKTNIYHTTIIVRECKPGSRWLDGCKRCFCDNGRKKCDERRCLKPRMPSKVFPTHPQVPDDIISGRPMQRPPTIPVVREWPITIKPSFSNNNHCGRYKERQLYWIKCNLCICTSGGPRCTAKSCG